MTVWLHIRPNPELSLLAQSGHKMEFYLNTHSRIMCMHVCFYGGRNFHPASHTKPERQLLRKEFSTYAYGQVERLESTSLETPGLGDF